MLRLGFEPRETLSIARVSLLQIPSVRASLTHKRSFAVVLRLGFEPRSSARKAEMIGRTTPTERSVLAPGSRHRVQRTVGACFATGCCRGLMKNVPFRARSGTISRTLTRYFTDINRCFLRERRPIAPYSRSGRIDEPAMSVESAPSSPNRSTSVGVTSVASTGSSPSSAGAAGPPRPNVPNADSSTRP